MSKPLRLTRHAPAAMSEEAYRPLRRFSREAGRDESVTDQARRAHLLRMVDLDLEGRKR
jgi:hypothetical protein